jgi:hypothetical protein
VREHPRWDVLKPSTRWCWPDGPPDVRLPDGSLGDLAVALVDADGAALFYARWGYALRWSDLPPRQEEQAAVRAIREYKLTYHHQNRGGMETDDRRAPPGPFIQVVALCREDQGADLSDVDRRNMRDAIWRLLDEAGAAVGAIG